MNRPPKNITSVTRNSHMPSVDASCCCSSDSNWCCSFGWWCPVSWAANASDNADLPLGVLVGVLGHDRRDDEVFGQRRRLRRPLEACGAPRVRTRDGAVL